MAQTRIESDVVVVGNLSPATINLPAGSVTNASVAAGAGVAATKLQHRYQPTYAQATGATAAAGTQTVHVVYGATATVLAFRAGCIVANIGDSAVTVDLHKNGASILSAPITIDSADAARAKLAGSVTGGSLVAGDMLEVVVTATIGTGTLGTGVFAQAVLDEAAA